MNITTCGKLGGGGCEWPHCECKVETFPQRIEVQPVKARIEGYLATLDTYGVDGASNCYWTPTTASLKEICELALKGLAASPEGGAPGWTEANHREESLQRAIHALPGTEWTFWLEHEGTMYAHKHVLPAFPSPLAATKEKT